MTTHEWLNRAYNVDKEINILLSEQANIFNQLTSCTANYSDAKVQTSQDNGIEHKFISYLSYSEKINSRINELYEIKNEIFEAINEVENPTLRQLLILRYMQYKTWECIAEELGYDVRHIYRLKNEAVREVEKKAILL